MEIFLGAPGNSKYNSFLELYQDIEEFTIKSIKLVEKSAIKIKI